MELDEFWRQIKEPMVVDLGGKLIPCTVITGGFMNDLHYIYTMPYWEAEA